MSTMSSYDLKVTGLIKPGADPHRAEEAATAFAALFPEPYEAHGEWSAGFVLQSTTKLRQDVTVDDEQCEIPIGSLVAVGSLFKAGSIVNGKNVMQDTTVSGAPLRITHRTFLEERSVLKKDTELAQPEYKVSQWSADSGNSSQWEKTPAGVTRTGRYILLTFLGGIIVTRPGSLGHHWSMQVAQDDLEWFYTYRKQPWFLGLLGKLITFNATYADILEEKVRIRDLKWYCGNGAGP